MSTTLEAPAAVQEALLLPDDEKTLLSTVLNPPVRLPSPGRPQRRFSLRRLAPRSVPRLQLDQLPLEAIGQPVLSAFDRVARDFPDLFILASSY